jgi:hypothetical protein
MLGKSPKKTRRKKPADGGYLEQDFPGIIPMMNELADTLPEDLKPHGKRIVGILTIAIIVIFAIFILGAIIASLTGHSDQIMNIFAYDIIGVGVLAVAVIVLTFKGSIK